jgi:DNA-binding NarL/FixJ family response regulator
MIASSVGAVGPVAYYLARAETSLGEHEAAVRHLEAAITLSGRAGFAPWVARSRLAHAEALLGRNRPDDRDLAIRSARLAAASAERLGMTRLLVRAQHLLAGVEGRERLTPRELEVVAFVAAGSTNREIAARLVLSDRTVETHVQNILGKLGFRSRAEIAAWAARERIGDQATT